MSLHRLSPDRSDATPLYVQVANSLRQLIQNGEIDDGAALPSERTLSELTGASRVTIRKAIERLVEEGLLLRRHGSGTYLRPRIEQSGEALTGFSADAKSRGAAPGSIWLLKSLATPTPEEAEALQIKPAQQVARIGRVRLANGEPLCIEHAVVPAHFLPPLEEIEQSLYAALDRRGNRPATGQQRLQASLATSVEAALLSIEENGAILRIERRSFLANGAPVEFTRSAYSGDRYDYITHLRVDADH